MHRKQVDFLGTQALEGLLDLFVTGLPSAIAQAYFGRQEQRIPRLELIDEFTHHCFSRAVGRRAVDHLAAQLLEALNRRPERRFLGGRLNLLVAAGGGASDYWGRLA